ncbi:MAG: tetratricopeptide repeat protein [Acidobacteria bacterium]|nr:tetratricopeptide repeat protein [Acidobacteriota bacterium]
MKYTVMTFLLLHLPAGMLAAAPPPFQSPQSGTTRSAPAMHTIRGRLYMPDGFPAQIQIRVTLRTITQAIVQEAFTDSVGNFEFRSIPNGNYEIVTWGTDEGEASAEKIEVSSRVSRTFFANIFLRSKPEDSLPKPKGGVVSVGQLDPKIPKSARKEYERGVSEVAKGDHEKAIARFRRAVEIYPRYFQALNDLGVQYSKLSRFDEAETAFVNATALDPHAAFPYLNLGCMRIAQKQFPEAVKTLTRVVELDAMNWAGHLWLGVALMETKQYDSSREELEKALSLGTGPEVFSARLYLANLYIRQGDLIRAIEQSELYLKDAPKVENADEVREKISQMRSLLEKNKASETAQP